MAQGTRGRLLLAAATGFGIVICTGLAGCQNTDKSKDTKVVPKQPAQGLPGTATLAPNGTATQPNTATGTAVNRTGTQTNPYYGSQGSNIQSAGGIQPAAGTGLGAAPVQSIPTTTQFRSDGGINTLNSPPQQQQNFGTGAPRSPGMINAPVQPGVVSPTFGGTGMAPPAAPAPGGSLGNQLASAPSTPPSLSNVELPPPPQPPLPPISGSFTSGSVANNTVAPPLPLIPGPIEPQMPAPPSGKPQSLQSMQQAN